MSRLAAFVLFVLAFIGGPGSHGAMGAAQAKYCQATAPNIVIYIDKTTPYDEIDKAALIDGISRLFESLSGGERFTMRTIAESFSASTTLVDDCVPVCECSGLLCDLFSDCTEGMLINDKKRLRGTIVQQLQALLDDFVELPNSEIVRTLAMSAPMEIRPGRANRFYLFTDLIENSLYMPGKDFFNEANGDLLAKVAADGLVPDLTGVEVRIFGVGRGGTAERRTLDQPLLRKLQGFWLGYFEAAHTTATIQPSLGAV
jgi:hypothetical protein